MLESDRLALPLLPGGSEEDEDEETLQLKLLEIQAKLRLKKLQSSKGNKEALGSESNGTLRTQALRSPIRVASRGRGLPSGQRNIEEASHSNIQVPASPVRKTALNEEPKSPRRVILGIDKGLKGKDVSLKRAPSIRSMYATQSDTTADTGFLRRSKTPSTTTHPPPATAPVMTFSQRLESARLEEEANTEKLERIRKVRTQTFGIGEQEMESFKQRAVQIPVTQPRNPTFSRDEIVPPRDDASLSQATRAATVPQDPSEVATSSFEPYSSFHLSQRTLPHPVLARQISGMKVYQIKELLKKVKSPNYALPDDELSIVVFGIVGKKSEPRAHRPVEGKEGSAAADRGKYMIMSLTDLKWEIDLFLFNTGFTRFWKLTEGTVIAILNPDIMPPPPGRQDTGKFSLVINSDGDTIIEVGSSRDLGFCQSMKKDGTLCGSWINAKRTKFCEFHSNEAVTKQRKKRTEINGANFAGPQPKKHNAREAFFRKPTRTPAGQDYDRETGSQYFTARRSASDLLDGKDQSLVDRKERAEHVKRKTAAQEKEREIIRKLGRIGSSTGSEYMERVRSRASNPNASGLSSVGESSETTVDEVPPRLDAAAMELLGKGRESGRDIRLSPVKRKRTGGSGTVSSTGVSKPVYGWGGELRNKLSKMKEGEKLHKDGDASVPKKTRFVTPKGIREAGRESLGLNAHKQLAATDASLFDDDDDDELIVV